jgi:hypothetical protein
MQRYWEQHPPLGDLVAAYMGYKAPAGATGPVAQGDPAGRSYGSLEELMAAFSASGGKVK